jgi:hypothetical protein
MNLDYMSSSKLKMFVKDIRVFQYGIKQEELDLVYLKVLKAQQIKNNASSSNAGTVKKNTSVTNQKMDFTGFFEALKCLARRIYPKIPPANALIQLLLSHVLPYAKRNADEFNGLDVQDSDVQSVFTKYRKNLQRLFSVYCNQDGFAEKKHPGTQMSCNEMFTFATDFSLTPKLISKKDVYRIFRSTIPEDILEEIKYDQFEECLVKYSVLGYSKHPYNKKYPTVATKLQAIFDRMDIKDFTLIRKRLEKLGRSSSGLNTSNPIITTSSSNTLATTASIPPVPPLVSTNSSGSIVSISSGNEQQPPQTIEASETAQQKQYTSLPSEDELDTALRDIFLYYTQLGDKFAVSHKHMTSTQFVRFVKEARIIGDNFSNIDADLTFIEVTKKAVMTYDVFCDSLAIIAQKKFESLGMTEGLRELLLNHVLPFARTKETILNKDEFVADPLILQHLKKYETQLSKVFRMYCGLEFADRGVGKKFLDSDATSVGNQAIVRLCKDFHLCPELISVAQLNDIFVMCAKQKIPGSSTPSEDNDGWINPTHANLTIEKFLRFLAIVADKGYEFTAPEETMTDKAHALINRMDLRPHRIEIQLKKLEMFAKQLQNK